jgi:hypothetical protein
MLYLQLAAFPMLIWAGVAAGCWMARRRIWWVAVLAALAVIGLVILGHRSARLHFVAPVSWAVDADIEPPLMTAAIGVIFATLLPKLPRKRTRVFVTVAMGVMLTYYGLLPALLPLIVRPRLGATPTLIDRRGVCLQTHAYTCGPAAAVTCLGQLGLAAKESNLAIDSRCAPALGADGHVLAAAIAREFPMVRCQYRFVDALENLQTPAVVDMLMPRIGGHYVAVLEIAADNVVIGDPLSGHQRLPRAEFLAQWQHGAIELAPRTCGRRIEQSK